MKNLLNIMPCGLAIAALTAAASCSTDDNDNPNPKVYVAGCDGNRAMLWKNGVAQALPYGTFAHSVFVAGRDVYAVGYQNEAAVLWKNGEAYELPDMASPAIGGNIATSSVYVFGGKVYVAGVKIAPSPATFDTAYAALWNSGKVLPLTDGESDAGANSLCVAGADVYVAGYNGDRAMLWKIEPLYRNARVLPGGITASSVCVAGDDVYVAGTGYADRPGKTKAMLWKNGEAQEAFTDDVVDAEAYSVCVSGSDVYVAGTKYEWGKTKAMLWKNGVAQELTDDVSDAEAYSVCVTEDDVYVAGAGYRGWGDKTKAILWKNGEARELTDGTSAAKANAVFVK
ncbi:MAG: hypothetical protein LBO71_01355 [Prevotellaceae bacterium]|jgi:uncharacterized membrane protein|nr:hypothetical protein [Prevotellaceae bacterium]